jgi:hypothetical protein
MGEGGWVVDVRDRQLQLLREVGDLLDDLGEGALDVVGEGVELRGWFHDVGQRVDPGDQVGLLGDEVSEANPLGPLDEDADGTVRNLQHARDDPGHAHVVELLGPGLLGLRVLGGHQREHALA